MRRIYYGASILPLVYILALAFIMACAPPRPETPPTYRLPPPVELPDDSLLPPEPPSKVVSCTLPDGKRTGQGDYLTPEQTALLDAELLRLDGLDESVQEAEREQSALVIGEANEKLSACAEESYKAKRRAWRRGKALLLGIPGAAAVGFVLGVIVVGGGL